MKVGVVSETHGYVDPRVLDALRELAPVYAVCGNNDEPLGCLGLTLLISLVS